MDSLQGSLLVASPHLPDPNFFRTVVLIIEHNEDGALGVVLNRVSNTPLSKVWESICGADCISQDHLFVGGPVEGPLMALHGDAELDGLEVVPGIYFTSERSSLEQLVGNSSQRFRMFSGYAGWGAGQLDAELRVGGWLTAPANPRQVLGDVDELWHNVTHAIGSQITDQALRIRHKPNDPRNN